jgi:hypothetical protein
MSDLCTIFNKITGCEVSEDVGPLNLKSKDPKARYSRNTISLAEPFNDKEYHLAGSFLGVVSVTGGASCTIKLDYIHSGVIDLREVKEIKAHFNKLYITTDGTGGVLTLYVCQAMETVIEPETKNIYTGMIYSNAPDTENDVQRLEEASMGFHLSSVIIRNAQPALGNDAEIGYVPFTGTLPNRAIFTAYSFRLIPKSHYTLTKVNAAGLGYCSTVEGNHANLKIIGTIA